MFQCEDILCKYIFLKKTNAWGSVESLNVSKIAEDDIFISVQEKLKQNNFSL